MTWGSTMAKISASAAKSTGSTQYYVSSLIAPYQGAVEAAQVLVTPGNWDNTDMLLVSSNEKIDPSLCGFGDNGIYTERLASL